MEPIPKEYRDRYKGQVAIILGNGPSIKHYDLTHPFFTQNVTFGSNAIGKVFKPTFYCVMDVTVPRVFKHYITSCSGHSTFLVGSWLLSRLKVAGDPLLNKLKPAYPVYYNLRDYIGPPDGKIYNGRTSGCVMVHIAYLMGFKYVFLLGIDGYAGRHGNSWFYGPDEGCKWANDNEALKSDIVAAKHLTTTLRHFIKNDRYLYSLSDVSSHTMIPKYDLPEAKNDRLPK